ncbi:MAG TPA: hypothetical protein VIL46_04060, partial [Gemmataceae bacterium]
MPTLLFPDPDSLRLALASGVVPAAVSAAPGRAGIDPRGRIWLHTDAALPRETLAGLTRFGVRVLGSSAVELTEPVTDWHQLLPLQPAPEPVAPYRRIIVEVPGRELPGLTAELRRQGNTSYAVCWADGRSLVRIDNPPPFTAARFAEPCPVYAEQAPGVWVARGWRHPAAAQVRPPRGSLLLLRPPREWAPVAKSDFREEPASYPLPRAPS